MKMLWYMKHMDPLSTETPSKNSSASSNPPKNYLKVQFSALSGAENVPMAPYWHQTRKNLQAVEAALMDIFEDIFKKSCTFDEGE